MEIDDYKSFMDDLDASVIYSGNKLTREEVFLEERCEFLVEQDLLQDYHILNFESEELNMKVSAWGQKLISSSSDIGLVLVVSDFRDSEAIESQTLSTFKKYLMKAKRFADHSIKESFRLTSLSANSEIANLADFINDNRDHINNITIVGLTNTKVTTRDNKLVIVENTSRDFTFAYDVWDIERLLKIDASATGRESVDIDFVNDYGIPNGIPALQASVNCNDITSFLFIVSGEMLAKLYEQWNERLLEQNPRTFLQFGGKVNKGIRNTIMNEPDRFFSYNNGISAVADSIDFDEDNSSILSIQNFQIVNGGQTTASIYNTLLAAKKSKKQISLDKIFVMVKLSVIFDSINADEIIPKISEYSNTQNKVNSASFSSHHPYHKKMEEFSRKTRTPSSSSEFAETKWYYERVLGQYRNSEKLAKSKKLFLGEYPKKQMFKPVDLAKYVMAFDQRPHIVCLGAQKCYAKFCSDFLKTDTQTGVGIIDGSVNEELFKENCAKAIIFKALEERQGRGIRFVIVPYIIAVVVHNLEKEGLVLDYQFIWRYQWDNDILFNILSGYADPVLNAISNSQPDSGKLLSEWGKKPDCWIVAQKVKLDIDPLKEYCITVDEYKDRRKAAQVGGNIEIDVDVQKYVLSKPQSYWKDLGSWCFKNKMISNKEADILSYACNPRLVPSAKQCNVIATVEKRALAEGFNKDKSIQEAVPAVNIIDMLNSAGINYLDKRRLGGALWVLDSPAIRKFVDSCKTHGIYFRFAISGSKATKGQPGWWFK